jgi:hypothetical protein
VTLVPARGARVIAAPASRERVVAPV